MLPNKELTLWVRTDMGSGMRLEQRRSRFQQRCGAVGAVPSAAAYTQRLATSAWNIGDIYTQVRSAEGVSLGEERDTDETARAHAI